MPFDKSEPDRAQEISFSHQHGLLEAGYVLDNKFKIDSLLGIGGLCAVYKAEQIEIKRIVAVKVLHPKFRRDAAAFRRVHREAVLISTLRHPNIVTVYAVGVWQSMPYIVMEYLQGVSLATLIEQVGRLTLEQARPLFGQICDGLVFAHENGIVHGDLKPSNIMLVESQKTVKIVDFGMAKLLPESGKEMQRLTQTGEMSGTLAYMSPEQCLSGVKDARSDIYSLGCIMYESLDGSPPFTGDSPYVVMSKQVSEQAPVSKYIDEDFDLVIRATLKKEPTARLQSVTDLKKAILNAKNQAHNRHRGPDGRIMVARSCLFLLLASLIVLLLKFVASSMPKDASSSKSWLSEQTKEVDDPTLADPVYWFKTGQQSLKDDPKKALRCFDQATILLKKQPDRVNPVNLRIWQAEALLCNNRLAESVSRLKETLPLLPKDEHEYDDRYARLYRLLALDYESLNDLKTSLSWRLLHIDYVTKFSDNESEITQAYLGLERTYYLLQRYLDCIKCLKHMLALSMDRKFEDKAVINADLGTCYVKLSNQDSRFAYLHQEGVDLLNEVIGNSSIQQHAGLAAFVYQAKMTLLEDKAFHKNHH